jgi:hypothetical protein
VAFAFEGTGGLDSMAQTGEGEETKVAKAVSGGKGARWFEETDEFEISIHASFIAYTVQCLMAGSKWESLVDISNRLNAATSNEFASQLLPFIIYAQSTLHEQAAQRT